MDQDLLKIKRKMYEDKWKKRIKRYKRKENKKLWEKSQDYFKELFQGFFEQSFVQKKILFVKLNCWDMKCYRRVSN